MREQIVNTQKKRTNKMKKLIMALMLLLCGSGAAFAFIDSYVI